MVPLGETRSPLYTYLFLFRHILNNILKNHSHKEIAPAEYRRLRENPSFYYFSEKSNLFLFPLEKNIFEDRTLK